MNRDSKGRFTKATTSPGLHVGPVQVGETVTIKVGDRVEATRDFGPWRKGTRGRVIEVKPNGNVVTDCLGSYTPYGAAHSLRIVKPEEDTPEAARRQDLARTLCLPTDTSWTALMAAVRKTRDAAARESGLLPRVSEALGVGGPLSWDATISCAGIVREQRDDARKERDDLQTRSEAASAANLALLQKAHRERDEAKDQADTLRFERDNALARIAVLVAEKEEWSDRVFDADQAHQVIVSIVQARAAAVASLSPDELSALEAQLWTLLERRLGVVALESMEVPA